MVNDNLALSLACGEQPPKTRLMKRRADGVFECKTCRRRFPSFQALGGHRTSHGRPRAGGHGLELVPSVRMKKARVHLCSICGLGFSMGQALGGHMRRHRPMLEALFQEKAVPDLNTPPADTDWSFRGSSHGQQLLELFR